MYECFHCGARAVSWEADFNFKDYGFEGESIIHECTCGNCGARIIYLVEVKDEIADK